MTRFLERLIALALIVVALAADIRSAAAAPLDELRIDWATYNPVSIVIRTQGLLEKEFEKDGTKVRWVQSLGSNKALEFLNASSI
jgi:sulfonate transport system substrate-binding protein